MVSFLVEVPDRTGHGFVNGANKMIVEAADSANALAMAQGQFDGDANAMWAAATATVIAAPAAGSSTNLEFSIEIRDASPVIEAVAKGGEGNVAVLSGSVNDGGTATYVIDEILTAIGGTFKRAATFRVITVSTGVILTVEMVDPGEYTVAPSLVANAVAGGGGSGALLDIVMASADSYEVLVGQMVTLLNADAQIADSDVDFSSGAAGARLFTISSIADGLGDLTVSAAMRGPGGPAIPQLLSTVVDGDVSGAVLTIAIPGTVTLPSVTPVKGV